MVGRGVVTVDRYSGAPGQIHGTASSVNLLRFSLVVLLFRFLRLFESVLVEITCSGRKWASHRKTDFASLGSHSSLGILCNNCFRFTGSVPGLGYSKTPRLSSGSWLSRFLISES